MKEKIWGFLSDAWDVATPMGRGAYWKIIGALTLALIVSGIAFPILLFILSIPIMVVSSMIPDVK